MIMMGGLPIPQSGQGQGFIDEVFVPLTRFWSPGRVGQGQSQGVAQWDKEGAYKFPARRIDGSAPCRFFCFSAIRAENRARRNYEAVKAICLVSMRLDGCRSTPQLRSEQLFHQAALRPQAKNNDPPLFHNNARKRARLSERRAATELKPFACSVPPDGFPASPCHRRRHECDRARSQPGRSAKGIAYKPEDRRQKMCRAARCKEQGEAHGADQTDRIIMMI